MGWVWLGLLRAGALAVRPSRLLMAFFLLIGTLALAHVPNLWLSRSTDAPAARRWPSVVLEQGLQDATQALRAWRPDQALRALVQTPVEMAHALPAAMLVLALPLAIVWGLLGGAIARGAAVEHGLHARLPWPQALAQALSRGPSLVVAALLPMVLVAVPLGGLILAGGAVFAKPQPSLLHAGLIAAGLAAPFLLLMGLKPKRKTVAMAGVVLALVVGGVLALPASWVVLGGAVVYGLLLMAGLATVLMAGVALLAWPVGIAAVMCEGCDALEALQRSWAYVIARPLRALASTLLLAGMLVLLLGVAWIVIDLTLAVTAWASTLLAPRDGPASDATLAIREAGRWGGVEAIGTGWSSSAGQDAAGTARVASIVGLWVKALALLAPSLAISYLFVSGSMLYLGLRRVIDGQDESDVWDPTLPPRAPAAARITAQDSGASGDGRDEEDA